MSETARPLLRLRKKRFKLFILAKHAENESNWEQRILSFSKPAELAGNDRKRRLKSRLWWDLVYQSECSGEL